MYYSSKEAIQIITGDCFLEHDTANNKPHDKEKSPHAHLQLLQKQIEEEIENPHSPLSLFIQRGGKVIQEYHWLLEN